MHRDMCSRLRNMPNMVEDVLRGTVLTNPGVSLLEGHRVVLRRDQERLRARVKVMSGGGTGREPWPAGYVGAGLLAAAVLGEPNTAPPPAVILQAIRHLACGHFQGILVIVRNITGNRLNFGAAVERARADDIDARLLLVGSVSRPRYKRMALHYMDSTIILCKIAGAMAESGCPIDDIYHLCKLVAAGDLTTVGASLAARTGDADPLFRFSKKQQFMGPSCPLTSVSPKMAMRAALNPIFEDASDGNRHIDPAHPIVVFIDNAGKSPKQEESIMVWETVSYLRELGYEVPRAYCGACITSPEDASFFVTLLRISYTCVLKYLDAPTTAVSWPHHFRYTAEDGQTVTTELPLTVEPAPCQEDTDGDVPVEPEYTVTDKFAACVLQVIKCTTKSLIDSEKQLNLYDEFGGGRDCGTNVKKVAKAIERAITDGDLDGHNLFKLFRDLSRIVESVRAGVTGLLYAIFFEAAAKAFRDIEDQDAICEERWLQALEFGLEGLFRCTCSPSTKGTMLETLLATIKEWHKQLDQSEALTCDWVPRLGAVVKAAENAALRTAEIRSDTGTSVIPDPGAYTVGVWLRTSFEVSQMLF